MPWVIMMMPLIPKWAQYNTMSMFHEASFEGITPIVDNRITTSAMADVINTALGGLLKITALNTMGAIMDVPVKLTRASSASWSLM